MNRKIQVICAIVADADVDVHDRDDDGAGNVITVTAKTRAVSDEVRAKLDRAGYTTWGKPRMTTKRGDYWFSVLLNTGEPQ